MCWTCRHSRITEETLKWRKRPRKIWIHEETFQVEVNQRIRGTREIIYWRTWFKWGQDNIFLGDIHFILRWKTEIALEALLELKKLLQEPRMKVAALLDGRQITRPGQSVSLCVSIEVVESTPKVVCRVYKICGTLILSHCQQWLDCIWQWKGAVQSRQSLAWGGGQICQIDVSYRQNKASTWVSENGKFSVVRMSVGEVLEVRWRRFEFYVEAKWDGVQDRRSS